MKAKINVLMPVETITRELDFRLVLAGLHVNPGNRIFIGQHDTIHGLVERLDGGIYVGKNVFPNEFLPDTNLSRYRALKRQRFIVVHLDEEGGVYAGDAEDYKAMLRRRLDPRCLASDDYVCTWGDFQRDFYRSLSPACAHNVRTTGHPRFDLYRPAFRAYWADEVTAIRNRFGEHILVNTNCNGNNGLGHADTFSARLGYPAEDAKARLDYIRFWAHSLTLGLNIVQLVARLSVEFPDLNIVMRPHPAENWDFYRVIFRGAKNVHVVHEGPVSPWLLACSLVIQDGCTTAIEGVMAGTPVLTFRSGTDSRYDVSLAHVFGLPCHGEDDVVSHVGTILAGSGTVAPPPLPEWAVQLMMNLERESFAPLLAVLAEAEAGVAGQCRAASAAEISMREAAAGTVATAKSVARRFFPAKERAYRFFTRQHFSGFDPTVIAAKLDRVAAIVGKRLRHRFYSSRLMSMETES